MKHNLPKRLSLVWSRLLLLQNSRYFLFFFFSKFASGIPNRVLKGNYDQLIDAKGRLLHKYKRGLLTPLCGAIGELDVTIIVSGTTFSLTDADQVGTVFIKKRRLVQITEFPTNSAENVWLDLFLVFLTNLLKRLMKSLTLLWIWQAARHLHQSVQRLQGERGMA